MQRGRLPECFDKHRWLVQQIDTAHAGKQEHSRVREGNGAYLRAFGLNRTE